MKNAAKKALATAKIVGTIAGSTHGPMPLPQQYANTQSQKVPTKISQQIKRPPQRPTTSGR